MEITIDGIIEEVSEVFKCDVAVIKSNLRFDRVSLAKQAIILLTRKYNSHLSLNEIAHILCYSDKTSVSRANRFAWNNYEVDTNFKNKVQQIERKLLSQRLEIGKTAK